MTRWGCRDCRTRFGAWLSRCPRCGSAKELQMALNACTSCTTRFAVGLTKCPHCGSTDYVEDGSVMAKITRHGGASDEALLEPEPVDVPDDSPASEEGEPPAGEPEPEAEPEPEPEGVDEEPSPEAAAVEPEAASGPDYEAETVEQLRERLTARGLPKSGKRDDLVLRLLEDDDAPTAGTE